MSTSPSSSGDYGQELEKRKFDDKDETDYYDSLEFCADLVWNGELVLDTITVIRIFTFIFSPEYQVKQAEAHPRTDTALVIIAHNIISSLKIVTFNLVQRITIPLPSLND